MSLPPKLVCNGYTENAEITHFTPEVGWEFIVSVYFCSAWRDFRLSKICRPRRVTYPNLRRDRDPAWHRMYSF